MSGGADLPLSAKAERTLAAFRSLGSLCDLATFVEDLDRDDTFTAALGFIADEHLAHCRGDAAER